MMRRINKILIANRGEIACRIIRTARKMGICCICIYSDDDRNSLHVLQSDKAIYVGTALASSSYLNTDKICQIAYENNVDAVHPGYGFLSENGDFASKLENHNIEFIGPNANTINLMADKVLAKKIAKEANVNIVPGYDDIIESPEQAKEVANMIGLPIIIKATAGGGGKGMRIVRSNDEIYQAFSSATNEATKSFKDGRIFIEKYIESPRHIEIQILADKHGNTVCIGERECSIQRHNQKVIEETPSTFIDQSVREEMYSQSLNLAKKVNYFSAGTIEFIVDKKKNFYFLEMNTRLQVEHPVTELVSNIDIVEEMINIASGKKLRFSQENIVLSGSAIEARIYAEDPQKNFLPSSGRIVYYSEPNITTNIRIDSGVYEGSQISVFYDPMIAKIISYGKTREQAIQTMTKALNTFYIEGVATNIDFLSSIFNNHCFISGNINTGFINQFYKEGFTSDKLTEKHIKIFMITSLYLYSTEEQRNNKSLLIKNKQFSVFIEGKEYIPCITYEDNKLFVNYDNVTTISSALWNKNHKILRITINDEIFCIKITYQKNKYLLKYSGTESLCAVYETRTAKLLPIMRKQNQKLLKIDSIKSPLTGMIIKIQVETGQEINVKQPLFIVEAMKMENVIYSEIKTKIKKILVNEGSSVKTGDIILELE